MIDLSYLGDRHFLLQAKSRKVLIAPPPLPAKPKRQGVDVILSHWMSPAVADTFCKEPEAVKRFCGPGEYEVGGIFMRELAWWDTTEEGQTPVEQLIYLIRIEDITLVYLAALTEFPPEDQIEEIGPAQVLILPIGADITLDVKTQKELIRTFSPNYLIPAYSAELAGEALKSRVADLTNGTTYSNLEPVVDKFKIKPLLHGETTLLFEQS